ncbi:MAG: hypothetical protein HQM08_23115 [Candidatus Riflebacteria bacterium]|nr:hypothetical protein [Candidatus Riflebacteria bacterium]
MKISLLLLFLVSIILCYPVQASNEKIDTISELLLDQNVKITLSSKFYKKAATQFLPERNGTIYFLERENLRTGKKVRIWQEPYCCLKIAPQLVPRDFKLLLGDNKTIFLLYVEGFSVYSFQLDVNSEILPYEDEKTSSERPTISFPSFPEIPLPSFKESRNYVGRVGEHPPRILSLTKDEKNIAVIISIAKEKMIYSRPIESGEWALISREPLEEPK